MWELIIHANMLHKVEGLQNFEQMRHFLAVFELNMYSHSMLRIHYRQIYETEIYNLSEQKPRLATLKATP